ncbi:hypothetical protein CHISP_2390 [Chitinispirillum alkaliphilum]|nr:hypothetical protein CHISP_2390 [Chitinispirillum alkaliphilum]
MILPKIVLIFSLYALSVNTLLADEGNTNLIGIVEWSSSYVSEGVDELPNATILEGVFEYSLGPLLFGVSNIVGIPQPLFDVTFYSLYGFFVGPVELYLGAGVQFTPVPREPYTIEGYLELHTPLIAGAVLFSDLLYDFKEEKGAFIGIGLDRTFSVGQLFTLTPFVITGIDAGYLSEDNNFRFNHIYTGLEAAYNLTDQFLIAASLNKLFALDNLKSMGEGDLLWVSSWFEYQW